MNAMNLMRSYREDSCLYDPEIIYRERLFTYLVGCKMMPHYDLHASIGHSNS